MVICLTGFMGSGKSSVGRALSSALEFGLTDLDDYIVRMTGRTIKDIFVNGEGSFRDIELQALREVRSKIGDRDWVLSLGGGTLTKSEAQDMIFGHCVSIYLRARIGTIIERLKDEVDSRPMLKDSAIDELLEKRSCVYGRADYIIDTDSRPIEDIVSEIRDLVQV